MKRAVRMAAHSDTVRPFWRSTLARAENRRTLYMMGAHP